MNIYTLRVLRTIQTPVVLRTCVLTFYTFFLFVYKLMRVQIIDGERTDTVNSRYHEISAYNEAKYIPLTDEVIFTPVISK